METESSQDGQRPWPEALAAAMAAHRAGQAAEADQAYGEVLAAVPDHAQALRLNGILARDLGDLERSARLLRRAVEAAPEDPEPAAELGLSYLAAGYLGMAEDALRRALKADPDHPRALANLGALLQYRGHGAEAIHCQRRYLALEPGDLEIRCNLATTLLETGQGADALAECDRALAMAPGHPLLLAARGAVLCGLDRYAEAATDLERALALNPGDDMALINLGLARARLGDRPAAEAVLARAIQVNPDNARARADLVNLLAASGRADEAVRLGEEFLRRHPGERLVLGALAYALRDAGRTAEAAALLEDDRLVRVLDLPPPRGYGDLTGFHAALADVLTGDDSLQENPLSKSTRQGAQTGELNLAAHPALAALEAALRRAVADSIAAYGRGGLGEHPLMAVASERWTLRAWGTVLPPGGRQVPHMHPLAWLSGVYYVEVPEGLAAEGGQAGWLEFGAPPERFGVTAPPVVRAVEPRPGRLVIFPSWFYHRTLPFTSPGRRTSIAFDVMPIRP